MAKRCAKCKTEKPYTSFSRDKSRKDGYQPYCKDCYRAYCRANRLKMRKNRAEYYQENKEEFSERSKQYYQSNRSHLDRSNGEWRLSHPERTKEIKKKWALSNIDKCLAIGHAYRARKGGAISGPYDFTAIRNHYGNRCLSCGRNDVKLTIDHIIPISKGGQDTAPNIQPLCQVCNSSKGARHIDYRPDAGLERWIQTGLFDYGS